MIKCPNCGRDNAVNFNFCLDCGYDLKAYREAFPDGLPAAPPPPPPAVTSTSMPAMPAASLESYAPSAPLPPAPIALPQSLTPAATQSPLPPPPRQPTRPQAILPPEPGPPSFPPLPHTQPLIHAPPQPAPLPRTLTPPAALPPLPPLARSQAPADAFGPPALSMPPTPALVMPAPPMAAPLPPQPVAAPMPVTAPSAPLPVAPPLAPPAPPLAAPPQAAPAANACPSCGYGNAPTVKFCGNCGKRLDVAGAPGAVEAGGAQRTMFMHAADLAAPPKEKLCKLITIDQAGREGMTFTIKSGETLCGRVNGVILFFDDPFVSPTHCKFSFLQGKLKVIDQGSLNGVYLRVKQEQRVVDGDLLRVGRQLFRYESLEKAAFQVKKIPGDDSRIWGSPNAASFGRLVQILEDGRTGEIRLLSGERCQLGRENGDIVMPTDGFISGRHCVFTQQNGETMLTDLGSSNGTYVRVRIEADVGHGDFVLVGNQMLRIEIV